jgi:predicted nucleotide-binding protein
MGKPEKRSRAELRITKTVLGISRESTGVASMSRWDDGATNVVADLIDEAIKRQDIQAALREATSGDTESYAAAAAALRDGAKIDEFLAAVPAEASAYRETIRIGLEELRAYLLATYDEYRVICNLEENASQVARQKDLELEEMNARIVRVQAQEYAQGAGARRGSLFRRRIITESEQLTHDYHDGLEELTKLRRRVADIATQRRRFELRFQKRDPGQNARLEKAEGARNDLAMAVLEPVILPYLRSAVTKYIALADTEAEGAHPAAVWYPAEGTLEAKIRDRIDMAEEDDVVSQLEEVAPAKSAGIHGPGDKRSVFLVHGRDRRAARAMRDFLRSLDLQVIEWEHAVERTGQPTPYVGDVVLTGMGMADAVVVLLTPDDLVRLRSDLLDEEDPAYEKQVLGQARPNVLYEAGIADALDRTRTVLVEVGRVKSLSDLGGRNVIRFDGQAGSRHKLVNRLSKAGLQLNMTGEDWLETGDFYPSIDAARMSIAALQPETK